MHYRASFPPPFTHPWLFRILGNLETALILVHVAQPYITDSQELLQPESEVVDSKSIRSGNVLVQLIYPGL